MKRHRFDRRKPKVRKKFALAGTMNGKDDPTQGNPYAGSVGSENITRLEPINAFAVSEGIQMPNAEVVGNRPTMGNVGGEGGFNLGSTAVDSLVSVGSNLLNQHAISKLQTDVTPTTVPTRRRNYRSFLGETKRMLDRDYRSGMRELGDNALDGELGKAKLMSARLNAGSDAAVKDAMAREQFEGGQDTRQDRARALNAGTINAVKENNLNRGNQKIGAKVSANRAFAQESLDINSKSAQLDYDTQALLLKAIENSDTKVLARAAKQFGYTDVEMFIQDFMNRKLARR